MKPTTIPRRPSIHGVDENDVDGDVRVRLPPIPTFWRVDIVPTFWRVDVVWRVDVISQVPIRVIRRRSKRRLSRQINERRLNRGEEQKGEKKIMAITLVNENHIVGNHKDCWICCRG
jgi:hypothetical protein